MCAIRAIETSTSIPDQSSKKSFFTNVLDHINPRIPFGQLLPGTNNKHMRDAETFVFTRKIVEINTVDFPESKLSKIKLTYKALEHLARNPNRVEELVKKTTAANLEQWIENVIGQIKLNSKNPWTIQYSSLRNCYYITSYRKENNCWHGDHLVLKQEKDNTYSIITAFTVNESRINRDRVRYTLLKANSLGHTLIKTFAEEAIINKSIVETTKIEKSTLSVKAHQSSDLESLRLKIIDELTPETTETASLHSNKISTLETPTEQPTVNEPFNITDESHIQHNHTVLTRIHPIKNLFSLIINRIYNHNIINQNSGVMKFINPIKNSVNRISLLANVFYQSLMTETVNANIDPSLEKTLENKNISESKTMRKAKEILNNIEKDMFKSEINIIELNQITQSLINHYKPQGYPKLTEFKLFSTLFPEKFDELQRETSQEFNQIQFSLDALNTLVEKTFADKSTSNFERNALQDMYQLAFQDYQEIRYFFTDILIPVYLLAETKMDTVLKKIEKIQGNVKSNVLSSLSILKKPELEDYISKLSDFSTHAKYYLKIFNEIPTYCPAWIEQNKKLYLRAEEHYSKIDKSYNETLELIHLLESKSKTMSHNNRSLELKAKLIAFNNQYRNESEEVSEETDIEESFSDRPKFSPDYTIQGQKERLAYYVTEPSLISNSEEN